MKRRRFAVVCISRLGRGFSYSQHSIQAGQLIWLAFFVPALLSVVLAEGATSIELETHRSSSIVEF